MFCFFDSCLFVSIRGFQFVGGFLGNFLPLTALICYPKRHMRRYFLIYFFLLFGSLTLSSRAGVYHLNDGGVVSGDPISYNETGLIVRQSDGQPSTRTPWTQFTQESLKQLAAEAKTPRDKAFIEPFLEETVEKEAKQKQIVIKPVEPPARPTGSTGLFAGFSSPIFLLIFALIYAANIYAAYEIAFFKNFQPGLVCGVAAFAPWIGPIIFLCLPAKPDPMHGQLYEAVKPGSDVPEEIPVQEAAPTDTQAEIQRGDSTQPAPQTGEQTPHLHIAAAPASATPSFPAPIVFRRGEFSFNRRFFETKLAGFFRVVPGEAEKDMVVVIKSLRGDFIGKRITRVTQTELYLQVFKDNATHDEMIPFTEVQEVSIRHKDA
jgi:hypothetical protein